MKISKISLAGSVYPYMGKSDHNVCKQVSFGRTTAEHKSWGATINPDTKEGNLKLFTYPDAISVSAMIMPKNSKDSTEIELENKGGGIFEKTGLEKGTIKSGDKYQFVVKKHDGNEEIIKDPYSFKQEEINGASTVYDHSKFKWQNDDKWKNNPARITRTGEKTVREARIYALNPDTFTDKRSYGAIVKKLPDIKKMGFNTLEIMHAENTFSFNWGYDGVDKLAPSNYLGGPDELKELVDKAHGEGLNVVLDVVPNHIGPDGNQLGRSGPYVAGPNDFGDAINYEGENSTYVRDFMVNAMLNWAENYHVDGLRLDMTKYMKSDYALKQIAAEMNYHHPDVFLIAEDGRSGVSVNGKGAFWSNPHEVHDKRVTSPLLDKEYGKGKSEDEHARLIEKIINNDANLSRLGMDSEWDFNFYHQLDESLYSPEIDGLMQAALCAQDGVKYVMSHDEIGNFEGTRKIAKLMVPKLRLNDSVSLNDDDLKRAKEYAQRKNMDESEAKRIVTFQKAQLFAEKLAMKYQTGELDKYEITPEMSQEQSKALRRRFADEVLVPLGLKRDVKISQKRVKMAFEKSFDQNEMALAFTYAIPGAKMVFQGDESADLTPFRFFRKFESVPNEDYLFTEKGYKPAESALEESTLGKIGYSNKGKEKMAGFRALTTALNELNDQNPALKTGYINPDKCVEHPVSRVIATDVAKGSSEIFSVTNFGEAGYKETTDNEYWIKFPKGKWVEVLNTDDSKFGGTSRYMNNTEIEGDGKTNRPINLAGYSTVYFKKVG